eukprot:2742740-Prymnesium_polylepis.1
MARQPPLPSVSRQQFRDPHAADLLASAVSASGAVPSCNAPRVGRSFLSIRTRVCLRLARGGLACVLRSLQL